MPLLQEQARGLGQNYRVFFCLALTHRSHDDPHAFRNSELPAESFSVAGVLVGFSILREYPALYPSFGSSTRYPVRGRTDIGRHARPLWSRWGPLVNLDDDIAAGRIKTRGNVLLGDLGLVPAPAPRVRQFPRRYRSCSARCPNNAEMRFPSSKPDVHKGGL